MLSRCLMNYWHNKKSFDVQTCNLLFACTIWVQPKRVSCYGENFQQKGRDKCFASKYLHLHRKVWKKMWSKAWTKLISSFFSESLNLFDRFFSLFIPSVSLWITFHPLSPPPSLHSSYSNYRSLTLILILSFTNQLVPRETNSVVTTTENLIIRHRRSRILTNIKLQLSRFAQCFSLGGKTYCSCSLQL